MHMANGTREFAVDFCFFKYLQIVVCKHEKNEFMVNTSSTSFDHNIIIF